jgi:peptidyl-prolyl cis-trans isomerase D
MLQQMRKAQGWMIKGVLWAVVLAFVMTIFYSWGVRSSSGPTRTEVATIFGQPVSVQEFQRVQNGLYRTYRNLLRNRSVQELQEQFNFREMALEHIARQRLLLRMAHDSGLVVTNAELQDHLATIPQFQRQGRFDPALYRAVLQSQVPPIALRRFEEEQRQALLMDKINQLIRASAQVTEAEVQQVYRRENEQRAVRYVMLVPSLFASEVQIPEAELRAHYEAHKETYREPERRKIRYVMITPGRFRPAAEPTEAEIEDYYATHQDAFRRQEQVRARHILFKVDQGASPEQEARVRAKAEAVLKQLRQGADFAAMARAHSDDTSTAERGGDLGFFPRGQMVKAFEDAAFALPVGQVSDLVRTPFGYHILLVEDRTEAGVKSLVEARQEVITRLQQEKAQDALLAFIDDLLPTLEDNPDQFVALAAQHDLKVVTTPFVTATGSLPELKNAPNLVQRTFALVGQAVDMVEGENGSHYILQVAEVQPSTVMGFDAAREQVEADLRRLKSADLTRKTAEEWAMKAQKGTALAELAASRQVQVLETGLFARKEPVPQLGRNAAFTRIAFGLQSGETGVAHDGTRYFVIRVVERQAADMQAYEAEKATYREQVLRQEQQQLLVAFQNSLQARYHSLRQQGEIAVNPQYIF